MDDYDILGLPACRVCLKSCDTYVEMETIIPENPYYEPKTYFECFEACTQLEVHFSTGQPRHICVKCSNELCAAYEFISKARMSHEILLAQANEDIKYQIYDVYEEENPIDDEHQDIDTKSNNLASKEKDVLYLPLEENVEEEEVHINSIAERNSNEKEFGDSSEEQENHFNDDAISIDELNEEEIVEEEPEEEHEPEIDAKIKCNLCSETFTNLKKLKEHGEEVHEDSKFCCDICYHRFTYKYALSDHNKHKHDTSYVKCNECGTFIQSCLMRSHKRKEHVKTKFLCSACPRTFKTLTGLQIHSETHKENRQRNFECEKCNKKFLTERTFKVHGRTHRERKLFNCQLCDKHFLQKISLKLHMQMHRGETMDCMYCEKKFVRKTDLAVHMRFHTGNFPYECPLCDKRFAIVSHLNYHKKRHQGYVYKCEVCNKEFINKSGLRNHSFQHTIMPFNCSICKKGFPTKFKIRRHLKAVHHIEEHEDFDRFIGKVQGKTSIASEETVKEENADNQLEEE